MNTSIFTFGLLLTFAEVGKTIRIHYYENNSEEPAKNEVAFNGSFSSDFQFGVASAAVQIEGGWDADGKGETIWDRLTHTRPHLVENEDKVDVACDSYHLYKEDVALIKKLGFQIYRFSISWARILPSGDITRVNSAGVNYYQALIDELLKNGIQPMVTMYHWDLPQPLQDIGGWLNPLIADYMEDYGDLLFQLFGQKVKLWITINEPLKITYGYDLNSAMAPALSLDAPAYYMVAYNILRAHARVYRLYEKKYRDAQKGRVTICLDANFYKAKSSSQEDIRATERAWAVDFEIFANPVYSKEGDFPELVKTIVAKNSKQEGRRRSRLPQFTLQEIESIRGSFDYFALNHYRTFLCSVGEAPYSTILRKDRNVTFDVDPSWTINTCNMSVVPWGLRETLRFIKDRYNNPPVFITENGYCDRIGNLDDVNRIHYHHDYLHEVVVAKEKFGCNVIGYNVWSLLDSFEWRFGYSNHYGIVGVNLTDPKRTRTLKLSAEFFRKLLKTGVIPEYKLLT